MTSPAGSLPDLRIACQGRLVPQDGQCARHFIGLYLDARSQTIHGALVHAWGRGLSAVVDVVAQSRLHDARLIAASSIADPSIADPSAPCRSGSASGGDRRRLAAELAELAAEAVLPLAQCLASDDSSLRALGLLDFGDWESDAWSGAAFLPACDTALLAKLSGLTVIDDFPGRDLAHGGRGGPCEAAGAWFMLADRGIMPGRVIRALVDVDQSVRLLLLPPRQPSQLPSQLACYQLGPGLSLLEGLASELTQGSWTFDVKENLAVQGRRIAQQVERWRRASGPQPTDWTPFGPDVTQLLQAVCEGAERPWPPAADLFCSAIHLIAEQIADCVQHHLPQALPVGQLILAGSLRQHSFLTRLLKQLLPELQVTTIDDQVAATDCWRAVAAALLAMLHVDQVPANSPTLTGSDTPRVLGRISPGTPANWHRVLADMAATLSEKRTLRSAV